MISPELQQATIAELLARSGRASVPIRRSFTQQRTRGGGLGPLGQFVRERRRRALDLYLLLHAAASAHPWDVGLPAVVWARMLGLDGRNVGSTISRQWSWLASHRLLSLQAGPRARSITLLREDGSGHPYHHPGASQPGSSGAEGDYFSLPHAYWRMGLQDRLDLPAKAVLLIALSRPDDFILPLEHGAKWYGISSDTIRSGLRRLQILGLLQMRLQHTAAPLTVRGYRTERHYTLRPPFGPRVADGVSPE